MSRGVNKFICIGNACADADIKEFSGGGRVSSVTVAINDSYKNKTTGEQVDNTEFIRVSFFNKLADIGHAYIKKGTKLYVEGAIKTRKYKASDGTDRYSTEVIAETFQMLDGKKAGDVNEQQKGAMAPKSNVENNYDDDIPF